ncbi:MAG: membrane protein insertase YidC [Bacteroidota bacterium]
MNIFEIIMSPFLYFIEQVFLFGYDISNDYGFSIVFLSFMVSLFLLPIFILIEKAKKKDDAVKAKMKPLIDEIKRCYKGQERFYYIKTINRQHNYSSVRALIPILSLLLQIPFFLAAYQFLDSYEPLDGVSFMFIKNLGEPDGLLGVINILPIIMTAVNLLTAYFYTRNGNTSERKQMIVVAAIFLVLLFNLPSGLVLYWTMNNVFSFFRLFITNPEVFGKKKKIKVKYTHASFSIIAQFSSLTTTTLITFAIITLVAVFTQLNWAFSNNFDDIILRLIMSLVAGIVVSLLFSFIIILHKKYSYVFDKIKVQPAIFLSLLFLSIYFHLAAVYYFTGINTELNYFSLYVLIPAQFVGLLYFLRSRKHISLLLFSIASFVLAFVFLTQIFNLIVFISGNPIELTVLNLNIIIAQSTLESIIVSGIMFVIITTPFFIKQAQMKLPVFVHSNWLLFALSVLYLSGFVFLWNPLAIYASSPETFEFKAIDLLSNNLGLFIKTIAVSLVFYLLLPKKYKQILLFVTLFLVASCFIYGTIIPINVGTLQVTKYSLQNNLASELVNYLLEGTMLISIIIGISYLFRKGFFKPTVFAVLLLNIVLISQSLYVSAGADDFKKSEIIFDSDKSISFSKDERNVILFLTDMFHGWSMHKIMEEEPEISETLQGFVYYPNTISVSPMTAPSISAILTGFVNTPDKMNEDDTLTIGNKITNATEKFRLKVKSEGFDLTSTKMIYSEIDKSSFDTYLPPWNDDWSDKLNMDSQLEMGYTILWENSVFYSVPLFIKPEVYNKGKWMHEKPKKEEVTTQTKPYNFLQVLPHISNTYSKKPNFIYIHTMASHHPWDLIDDEGIFHADVSPYENNKWTIYTLGKWISWMKKNDVYNNTKIIILSDHGPHWGHYDGEIDIKVPFIQGDSTKINLAMAMALNPLLLVKDYNSQGLLKEDWRFMSNADAHNIAFDENDPTKGKAPDTRELKTWNVVWDANFTNSYIFDISSTYNIENNYLDLTKWKRLKKSD